MFYKQTTYESCLAVCLMLLIDTQPNREEELAIWRNGWEFNYLIGQLNYVSMKYGAYFKIYVENKYYYNSLKPIAEPSITLMQAKVDLDLLDKTLIENKVILYIDNYFLQKLVHAPHFVIIDSIKDDDYILIDPWDGEEKVISQLLLKKAILSLRSRLKFSPILITLNRKIKLTV